MTCERPNIGSVVFDTFDLATNVVVADYAVAVAGTDLMLDAGGAPGCMSGATDPECAPIFPTLGVDLASGGPSPDTLSFFRVE